MPQENTTFSLRGELKAAIAEFLSDEKFKYVPKVKLGVLEMINLLADYRDEDTPLFPDILLIANPDFLKTIPHSKVEISSNNPIDAKEFRKALSFVLH